MANPASGSRFGPCELLAPIGAREGWARFGRLETHGWIVSGHQVLAPAVHDRFEREARAIAGMEPVS
jgi:hypothetical protein